MDNDVELDNSDETVRPADPYRIILKFHNEVNLPYDTSVVDYLQGWKEIADAYPDITLEPLTTTVSAEELQELMRRAAENDPDFAINQPNLLTYFGVRYPPEMESEVPYLAEILSALEGIEYAEIEKPYLPAMAVNTTNETKLNDQTYLKSATEGGINALLAWQFNGGAGEEVQLADIEGGWKIDLGHVDLVDAPTNLPSTSVDQENFAHGTCVLGIIAAQDNGRGCVGIAPHLQQIHLVSWWRKNLASLAVNVNVYDAIAAAATLLQEGDILLLEVQTVDLKPIETSLELFNLIRTTTAAGIVVVEAAGNGGHNLDNLLPPAAAFPANAHSRAIMVAAGSPDTHLPTGNTSHGNRIDCFAQGESIRTTSLNPNDLTIKNGYTTNFGQTSGSAAIIAGAAAVLQGIHKSRNGGRIFPLYHLRRILRNPNTGTPSKNRTADGIGVMPDLEKIFEIQGWSPP